MIVDAELVEVDRGEARFLDGSCCWPGSRGPGRGLGGDRCQFRKSVRRTQRCRHEVDVVHDDLDGGESVGPFALVVSEDDSERSGAVLEIIRGVSVGGDDVVRDDVAVTPLTLNEDTLGGRALALALMPSE